jgi:hypothetical protein
MNGNAEAPTPAPEAAEPQSPFRAAFVGDLMFILNQNVDVRGIPAEVMYLDGDGGMVLRSTGAMVFASARFPKGSRMRVDGQVVEVRGVGGTEWLSVRGLT